MDVCAHCGSTHERLTKEHILPRMLFKWFGEDFHFVEDKRNITKLCKYCNETRKDCIIPSIKDVQKFYVYMPDEDFFEFCQFYREHEDAISKVLKTISENTNNVCSYCGKKLRGSRRILRRLDTSKLRSLRDNCEVYCNYCNMLNIRYRNFVRKVLY